MSFHTLCFLFLTFFGLNVLTWGAVSQVVQDLPVFKHTLPLILPGGSAFHHVDSLIWPMKTMVQNGADGKWLNDSRYMFGLYDYEPPLQPYYNESSPISEKRPKETVVFDTDLIYMWHTNHVYHFLMETFPQIYALYLNSIFVMYPNATILCGMEVPRAKESMAVLSALKIDLHTDKFVKAERGVTYKTDATHSLILPPKSRLFPHGQEAQAAKEWFLRAIGDRIPPNPHPKEQIYISRAGHRRHMLNETVLIHLLQQHIHLTVYNRLEDMTPAEQYAIFGNASLIIAPHGGALTNTMFCNKEKVAIIEVSGRKHIGAFNRDVASWGITKYHNIYVNNTDNLDLIFDPHTVAKEMLQFLQNISHPTHGPHH